MPIAKFLLIGELIIDRTVPVRLPRRARTVRRRSEPTVFEQSADEASKLGGVFYVERFLSMLPDTATTTVFPMPIKGRVRINDLLKASSALAIPVEVTREPYEATRFLELNDMSSAELERAESRGVLRVDRGDSSRYKDEEAELVLEGVKKALKSWLAAKGRPCIVLADYDLGLFTRHFIEGLRGLLPAGQEIPIVVYAGRRWRAYAALSNCHIVADTDEAVAEILDADGVVNPEEIEDNPFRYVMTRHSDLGSLFLADRESLQYGKWLLVPREHTLRGDIYTLKPRFRSPRIPVGYRACLAASLAEAVVREYEPKDWLPGAAESAHFNGRVLAGQSDRKWIAQLRKKSSLGGDKDLKREQISITAAEALNQRLSEAGFVLHLRDAETAVPGIFTMDGDLKKSIEGAIEVLKERKGQVSLFDRDRMVSKLLMLGPPGNGKTTIAVRIGCLVAGLRSKPKVNLVCDCTAKPRSQEKGGMAAHLISFVKDLNRPIAVLDEIDKIHGETGKVQRQIFKHFDNFNGVPDGRQRKKMALVILTCSRPVDSLNDPPDASHLPDLYSRFQLRITVSALTERPLDVAYILAARLFKKGVRRINLGVLLAAVERGFASVREVEALALELDRARGKAQDIERELMRYVEPNGKIAARVALDKFVTIVGDTAQEPGWWERFLDARPRRVNGAGSLRAPLGERRKRGRPWSTATARKNGKGRDGTRPATKVQRRGSAG